LKTFAAFRRAWEPSHEGDRHEAIDEYVETRLARYADDRDFPGGNGAPQLT
jgi:deoxyribodipyrimidine photolyase